MDGKIIILSAPSGCGKSTIIGRLMERGDLNLAFSISATSRAPRGTEKHGVDYYYLTAEEFRRRIDAGDFVEYEVCIPDVSTERCAVRLIVLPLVGQMLCLI